MASFTERYHECTKYNPVSIDRLGNADWANQPPPFKSVEGRPAYGLSSYLPFLGQPLPEAAVSLRGIPRADAYGSMGALSHLLYFTGGITGVLHSENGPVHFRANPSAGGLYPIETYFAVHNWDGLGDGIYLFHPLLCAAVPVRRGSFWPQFSEIFGGSTSLGDSRLVILFTGDFHRSAWRYRERAYRRILLDCGSIAANTLIHARLMGLGTHLLGGFVDQRLESLLGITSGSEVPLLGISVHPAPVASHPEVLQAASLPPPQAAAGLKPGSSVQIQQNLVERIPNALLPAFPDAQTTSVVPQYPDTVPLARSGLSEPDLDDTFLLQAIGRRSTRRFDADTSFPLVDLGAILDLAHKHWLQENCSDGLLHTWIIAHRISGLPAGVWYYDPEAHCLQLHQPGDISERIHEVSLGQDLARDCSALLIHTTNLDVATRRYGDRAYRYLNFDAGSIGEALALYAGYYGGGVSGIGGYFDDLCNGTCALPPTEAILYMTAIGVPSA